MDHEDLMSELPQIEKLSNQERLRLAHKRRMLQLKRFQQYDKEIGSRKHKPATQDVKKGSNKGGLNGLTTNGKPGGKRIKFRNSIMLLEAAGRNDVEEVRRLLSSGVSPDVCNEDGLTALHQTCIDDSEEMLKLLLDYGANVNAEDSERWTPLHAASTCGNLHLVKHLIAKGANLLAVNAEGNMPYDICDEEATLDYIESEMAKRGVTQELIEETRALPETVMLNDMQNILAKGGDLETRDADGATPLHIASANGYYRVVEFLLDNHVATDLQDKDGWQGIHGAACWSHMDVLELLVQNGADLNARTRNNETPYAICEDPEIKERIIQLKNEQEVKKEAANSRRLKRTQSSNSRTQSIRRTSQRDKGLATKRDTANEYVLMSRENLKDNSPSPTIDANGGGDPPTSNNMIEVSSEEDTEDKVASSHHPAAFGRGSVSQIKVASNDAERLQLLAEKAGMSPSSSDAGGPTTINNNLKSNHAVKNINVNSNINNHNQTKQLNTPKPPPQVIDTNANLPKPEINPPMDKVQIGSNGISLSGSRDSLVGVGNGTIDIHVQVTINTASPSSTLTHGGGATNNGGIPSLPSPYTSCGSGSGGILPGSTLLSPPGTLADLKKHRSLSRTTSNPRTNGGLNDLPTKSASSYGAPPSPTVSLQRFAGEPTEIRDYGDGGKKCCVIV
ncbi:protein phosphatase 1 regulatory subunit 16A isoform X2 [Folsomia candida]|uniref:protein phosphatase 1 regulatory subunit 16A isoform X2 n=1 Tax=Folsomia candida TaxID=158441 RepID=UPI001605191B|nr:protein phosphatase 1 regulatory subunit 16A isoform X2 [Folsomia candida]